MANVLVDENSLSDIADAIRSKKGVSTTYKPSEMADAISSISGGVTPSGTKTINITQNGSVTEDVASYANAQVNVNVPNPSTGTKTITTNGTYDVTQYASAQVNVPNPSTGSQTFTENGTYDVTSLAEAVVDVGSDLIEYTLVTDYSTSGISSANFATLIKTATGKDNVFATERNVDPSDTTYERLLAFLVTTKTTYHWRTYRAGTSNIATANGSGNIFLPSGATFRLFGGLGE